MNTPYYVGRCRWAMLIITLCLALLTGCGYKLRGITQVPLDLQTLILDSYDPYGPITRSINDALRASGIVVEENKARVDVPTLRILGYSEANDAASIFRNGKKAENQMSLNIDAQILIPGKDIYPIHILVQRTFIDNPLNALAKDSEQDLIKDEMRTQAAQQLLRKLLKINNQANVTPSKSDQ